MEHSMYNFFLRRLGMSEVSPKVLRWTNITVACLTLLLGTFVFVGLYHPLVKAGHNELSSLAISLGIYPLLLFCFGFIAYGIISLTNGVIYAVRALPEARRNFSDGCVSFWRGLVAAAYWVANVPQMLAAVKPRTWGGVLLMTALYGGFGALMFRLYPVARLLFSMDHTVDWQIIIIVDAILTMLSLIAIFLVFGILLTLVKMLVMVWKSRK
jgi:hypothetical protein